ncbi:DMT family transporter [Xanthocytophaga flava]|uniref:DMT family transporter n=1 Tax=Xanthocytophaga flava TaxID=3048013 RepID=UPI0028D8FDF7|nr:DMT family transporter [Xanthocytophaga flavus]MDJ1469577.1 DMT family transporter [Xanthocytophaga flavus]
MKKAFIKLHISIVLAGFTGLFGKLITLNEGLLAWYRILLAGILMLGILSITRRLTSVSLKDFLRISVPGFLIGLHWLFFYGSIKYANISVGVVCFSLTSFFTALFSPILNKHRIIVAELLLSMLTLAGIALIFSFDSQYRIGIGLGVISSIVGSLYTITNECLAKLYASEVIITYSMLGGALGLSIFMPLYLYFFPVGSIIPSRADFGYLLVLSLFCTVLLYLLQTQALRKISAFTINLSLNLEPVYTIILAIIIYQENKELTPVFYLGLGLIVLSVILQMVRVFLKNKEQKVVEV